MGWMLGSTFQTSGNVARANVVSLTQIGIDVPKAVQAEVTGNVAAGNGTGVRMKDAGSIVGNALDGNTFGIEKETATFSGTIAKDDFIGNVGCGLLNDGGAGLVAANDYWGAATGPGASPANDLCNDLGGTSTTTPFAKKPFKVKARITP